jgi:hypothetical protein
MKPKDEGSKHKWMKPEDEGITGIRVHRRRSQAHKAWFRWGVTPSMRV